MAKVRWLRPSVLFLWAAVLLAINSLAFFHSRWPPFDRAHWWTNEIGQPFLLLATTFGVIGLIYLALDRFSRVQVSTMLSYLHFGLSVAAIAVGMLLDLWLNLTYKTPGENTWDGFWNALNEPFTGVMWAVQIFLVAQAVFFLNLTVGLYRRLRTPAHLSL